TARRNEALVAYQRTVQTAFREVRDALSAHRGAREALAAESDRRNQLAQALDIARLRFDAGRTSFLEVLDVQRSLLAAETLRIAAARDAKLSIVAFAKALGGGWDPEVFATSR
ncbi:MAG: TolC family protein, partial [Betaproteobacteria bacterium]|nr:TolC family protein [Betaproteobacteria bacterium]